MNDFTDATTSKILKPPRLGNWKLNTLLIMMVFVIIGQLSLLGSLGQLYKKLNYVENYCSRILNQSTIQNFDFSSITKQKENKALPSNNESSSGYPPNRPR